MVHVSTHGLTIAPYVHGPSLDSQLICRTGMWGSTPRAKGTVGVHRLVDERRVTADASSRTVCPRQSVPVFNFQKSKHLPSEWKRLHTLHCARLCSGQEAAVCSSGFRLGASHGGGHLCHVGASCCFHERGVQRGGTVRAVALSQRCAPSSSDRG